MKHLTTQDAQRLAKICAMFSSNHVGERASAAAMADALVRWLGLTWQDVISSAPSTSLSSSSRPPSAWSTPSRARPCPQDDCSDLSLEELVMYAIMADDEGWLSRWEHGFVANICGRRRLTERQLDTLRSIVARCFRLQRAA